MFNTIKKFFKKSTTTKKLHYRNFSSAQVSRLTNDWLIFGNIGIDEILRWQLDTIRQRCRDVHKNNQYVISYIKRMQTNIIGENGFILQNKAYNNRKRQNEAINAEIESLWNKFCKKENLTTAKDVNFRDFCNLVLATVLIDGEAIINIVKGQDARNEFNFALQLIDTDLLNTAKNDTNKNITLGIEKNKYGQPIKYYFLTRDKKEFTINAENILHLYFKDYAGQTRGVSQIQGSLIALRMLNAYEEACLVAKRVAASKMGFIVMPNNENYGIEDIDNNQMINEVEAGMIEQLPYGADFKTFDPSEPKDDYFNYRKSILMSVASALGISYNALCNDYENVNFSSLRSAFINERDYFKNVQNWFIDNFVNEIFLQFIKWQVIQGKTSFGMQRFDDLVKPSWTAKRWDWVDPLKDINAKKVALENNLTSIHKILAEAGVDFDELMQEIKEEKEILSTIVNGGSQNG